jgi:hypothetical protein
MHGQQNIKIPSISQPSVIQIGQLRNTDFQIYRYISVFDTRHRLSDYVNGDVVAVNYIRSAQIPGARLPGRITFCTVAPDICGSPSFELPSGNSCGA